MHVRNYTRHFQQIHGRITTLLPTEIGTDRNHLSCVLKSNVLKTKSF